MKKLINLTFTILLSVGISATALAQGTEGDIAIGAGIAYGTDIEEIGLQASGTYVLNEDMRVGGDIIYWLTDDSDFASTTFVEVNANFNYIFHKQEDLIIYALGTLGIHYGKVDIEGISNGSSDTELGLGVGAGLEYDLGGVVLYVEPRLFLSGFDQLSLAAGVRFPI